MSSTTDKLAGEKPTTLIVDDRPDSALAPVQMEADAPVLQITRERIVWMQVDFDRLISLYRFGRTHDFEPALLCKHPLCWNHPEGPRPILRVEDPVLGTVFRCSHADRLVHDVNLTARNRQAAATERQTHRNEKRLTDQRRREIGVARGKMAEIQQALERMNESLTTAGLADDSIIIPTIDEMDLLGAEKFGLLYRWAVRGRVVERPSFLRLRSEPDPTAVPDAPAGAVETSPSSPAEQTTETIAS